MLNADAGTRVTMKQWPILYIAGSVQIIQFLKGQFIKKKCFHLLTFPMDQKL